MQLTVLFLIAIGLSFDTFAAAICIGINLNHIRFWHATKIAIIMALFQAFMPAAGWFLGSQVKDMISNIDHWFAFGLLSLIGIKMIWESLNKQKEVKELDFFKLHVIIGIAIATSIDALIVGISFALIDMNIVLSVSIIGVTTYLAAMLGMLFGKKAGKHLGKRMEIVGGLILIVIGLKILLEHLNYFPVF